eukprot:269058-Rhodomonas_salina.1
MIVFGDTAVNHHEVNSGMTVLRDGTNSGTEVRIGAGARVTCGRSETLSPRCASSAMESPSITPYPSLSRMIPLPCLSLASLACFLFVLFSLS